MASPPPDSQTPPPGNGVELTLVIPCYNEEPLLDQTVPPILEAFEKLSTEFEIVLVNNGSTDGTAGVIDRLCSTSDRFVRANVAVNKGYGLGVLAGQGVARGAYIGHIPADGPVSPNEVARIAKLMIDAGPGHLLSAVRDDRQETPTRRFVSKSYNALFNLLFGALSPDINGTPKFLHRTDLEAMDLKSTDYFLEAEMMIKAAHQGLVIQQIAVQSIARPGGTSKVSARLVSACYEFVKNLIRARLGRL